MKFFERIVVFFAVAVFATCFLCACNEKTLDDIPWGNCSLKCGEVVDEVEADLSKMIGSNAESAGLAVTFETTATYTFFATQDNAFSNKTVKDSIVLSLTGAKTAPKASLSVVRHVDNIRTKEQTCVYINNQSDWQLFDKQITYNVENGEAQTYLSLENVDLGSQGFFKLIEKVLTIAGKSDVNSSQQKKFENVNYYRLVGDNTTSLNNVSNSFEQNENLFENVGLFEVAEKGYDYVSAIDYQYGINDDNLKYVSYFAMHYDVNRCIQGLVGVREKYLSVEVVSKLAKKGDEVLNISKPQNVQEYAVCTFNRTVSANGSYVRYRDASNQGENDFDEILVCKQQNSYLVRVDKFVNNNFSEKKYYFVDAQNNVFVLNPNAKSYVEDSGLELDVTFVKFNYSATQKIAGENFFVFGVENDGVKVNMSGENVASVSTISGTKEFLVLDYGDTRPDDMFDLSGFAKVSED